MTGFIILPLSQSPPKVGQREATVSLTQPWTTWTSREVFICTAAGYPYLFCRVRKMVSPFGMVSRKQTKEARPDLGVRPRPGLPQVDPHQNGTASTQDKIFSRMQETRTGSWRPHQGSQSFFMMDPQEIAFSFWFPFKVGFCLLVLSHFSLYSAKVPPPPPLPLLPIFFRDKCAAPRVSWPRRVK